MDQAKKFDLNIEKILEDWEVYHAIREIIANALDEQLLTATKDIEIYKDSEGTWHIRDFGRGLRYTHLTENEVEEKLQNPHVIGKFGIGLKDALATFDRKGIEVLINSKHGKITLIKSPKYDFEDVITLQAEIQPPLDPEFEGTDFTLVGVTDEDIKKAKQLFLEFSGDKLVEDTKYDQVLAKKGKIAKIYINGVRGAEEEKFLFSYNITSLTKDIRKALNRERTNIGREAYSTRGKSILLSCESAEVANKLIEDLQQFESGEQHDELKWIDVQKHAVQILNAKIDKPLFLTPNELKNATEMVDEAKASQYMIVVIPENLKQKIETIKDINKNPIRTLNQFQKEYEENFEFKFIEPEELTEIEKKIFEMHEAVMNLIGGWPQKLKEIKISETMRKDSQTFQEAEGLWLERERAIIIKRTQLKTLDTFAATLLHEIAHLLSGAPDVSRAFEEVLTELLGKLVTKILGNIN